MDVAGAAKLASKLPGPIPIPPASGAQINRPIAPFWSPLQPGLARRRFGRPRRATLAARRRGRGQKGRAERGLEARGTFCDWEKCLEILPVGVVWC